MNRKILCTVFLTLILSGVNACADYTGVQPTASLYYTSYSTLTPITPSATIAPPTFSATVPVPTDAPTLTPEPDIALGCNIANTDGRIYILSDKIFFAFGPSEKELDQVLADNYPEWADFEQNVSWYSEPVRLGKIVEAASFQEQYNFNPAVTLITLGESLNWQLPPDSDLYLQSLAISEGLVHSAFEWIKPENEHIRDQYPEVSNGATYALYVFFDYDKEKLQDWCETYQRLFGAFANVIP